MVELETALESGLPLSAEQLAEFATLVDGVHRDISDHVSIDDATVDAYAWGVYGLASAGFWKDLDASVSRLESAAEISRSRGFHEASATVESLLTHLLRANGQATRAAHRLDVALAELQDAVVPLPLLYLEKSECARAAGNRQLAQEAIDSAERAASVHRDQRGEDIQRTIDGYIAGTKASILIDLGLADRAAPLIERERSLLENSGDAATRAATLLHQCTLWCATDRHQHVVDTVRPLLTDPNQRAIVEVAGPQLRYLLGYALSELSHDDPSLVVESRAMLASSMDDSALDSRSRWIARAHVAELARRGKDFAEAARLLGQLRAASADDSAEPGAYRALLAALETRLALDSEAPKAERASLLAELEESFGRFLEEWSAAPDRSEGLGFLEFSERRAILIELVRLELDVRGKESGATEALERLVEAQALGTLARQLGEERVTFIDARHTLCTRTHGVLEYVPGPERSFVFAIDADRVICEEIAASQQWDRDRLELLALVSHPPGDTELEQRRSAIALFGGRLANALLPPTIQERLLRWDHVAVVGIDLLGCTPFDVLPLDDRGSLGTSLAVTYLPSLTVACRLMRREPVALGATLRLDVLAAPTDSRAVLDRSWGWSAIAWDPSHEARLRAALGSGSVRVFIGDAASLVTLSEHRDPGADVVEVMAHGFYEPLSEPPAGVALAECPGSDGLVHATDLLDIASGRLTVLAVCGAGRTPLRSGDDGVSNLSGAFLRAGAQCIVLSPVDLDQSATEELLLEFYGKLAQGRSPAEAMLSARRKLSKSERFADPFYHSMLQVVGLGFRPLVQPALAEERATSRWHLPLLAAAAVLLIGVITWRLVVRSHRARTRTESSATA